MGRIAEILTRARDSLGDDTGTRWSDARLLRLVDEAQKTIARKAKVLRAKTEVAILQDQNIYTLPDKAFTITRVVDGNRDKLPVISHADMDLIETDGWETDIGETITHIIFDKLNPKEFKVYPIPSVSDGGETFIASDFGVTTDITSDTMSADYGIVVDVTTTATLTKSFNSVYGVVTGMESVVTGLAIYYIKIPLDITAIDTNESYLEIDEIFDKAIKHYIVGTCLRDDKDDQNRTLGNEELALFVDELDEAKQDSSRNYTSTGDREVVYQGFI